MPIRGLSKDGHCVHGVYTDVYTDVHTVGIS